MRAIVFLALLAATAAGAHAAKGYRIGVLETTSEVANRANLDALRKGLREAGYVEGQNLVIDYRSADGRSERFQPLAVELVRTKPDVIVTRGFAAARAASEAGSIPIVMAAAADPVAAGIVKSLSHPGGHVTGLTTPVREVAGKRIELLKELAPQANRIAALLNLSNGIAEGERRQVERTAKALGMEAVIFDVRNADELQKALAEAADRRADALVVNAGGVLSANRQTILDFARRHRLPVMYATREYVESGGLIAFGVSYPDLYYRAASYVDRILKGARAGDLPIEKPTKMYLVINVSAATALGIPIPSKLLLRADELIR